MLKTVNILQLVSCAIRGIPLLASHYGVPLASLAKDRRNLGWQGERKDNICTKDTGSERFICSGPKTGNRNRSVHQIDLRNYVSLPFHAEFNTVEKKVAYVVHVVLCTNCIKIQQVVRTVLLMGIKPIWTTSRKMNRFGPLCLLNGFKWPVCVIHLDFFIKMTS
jgi:hypothetical protein